MADTIKLSKPIKINGSLVSELKYDIEEITAENLCEADARASTGLAARGVQNMNVAELNSSMHLYLGYFAIIACNPEIDIEDLKRVKGPKDLNKIRLIGRSFFTGTALGEEETTVSTESPSEDLSGAIVEFMESAPSLLED